MPEVLVTALRLPRFFPKAVSARAAHGQRVQNELRVALAAAEPADPRWMLGEDSISAGSLHCDVWTGPAIELLNRDTICVKPVNGWWRNRASTNIVNRKSRYALIVTLKARNAELDIYTPVRTSIGLPVPVEVETPV